MSQDIEGDFWKEVFMHAQHRNMSRIGATRITYDEAAHQIEDFAQRHPEIHPLVEDTGSYVTWETPITDTISLRLFIQSQVKGTLLQKNNGDWVKIADAKFLNNPFPEVEVILENRKNYQQEINRLTNNSIHENMQKKISGEFIKAYLMKLCSDKNTSWDLKPLDSDKFEVSIKTGNGEKKVIVTSENFVEILKQLF